MITVGKLTEVQSINNLVDMANKLNVYFFCEELLTSDKFKVWTGSGNRNQHHYGYGGLVIHTCEVVRICLSVNDLLGTQLSPKKIFLSALFHDVGKIWDYEYTNEEMTIWQPVDHKVKIYHITRSILEWNRFFESKKGSLEVSEQDESFSNEIIHAILGHHGRLEWHSPVKPRTKLAFLLHYADSISARLDDADLLFKSDKYSDN